MALFGAPIALEDAPQRAIRSGLAIHGENTCLSERMTREKGITPLRMRVGIHSGPVVVGTVGIDLRVEFRALGDTVNLASRMESQQVSRESFGASGSRQDPFGEAEADLDSHLCGSSASHASLDRIGLSA
jgi:hypothetical protein